MGSAFDKSGACEWWEGWEAGAGVPLCPVMSHTAGQAVGGERAGLGTGYVQVWRGGEFGTTPQMFPSSEKPSSFSASPCMCRSVGFVSDFRDVRMGITWREGRVCAHVCSCVVNGGCIGEWWALSVMLDFEAE